LTRIIGLRAFVKFTAYDFAFIVGLLVVLFPQLLHHLLRWLTDL